jgi:hypothetical protein
MFIGHQPALLEIRDIAIFNDCLLLVARVNARASVYACALTRLRVNARARMSLRNEFIPTDLYELAKSNELTLCHPLLINARGDSS